MRRTLAQLLLIACLALALACNRVVTSPGSPEGAPSLLLVSIDTLRADRVGAYGGDADATPHLDALAGAGVRFETAIAPAPLTLPSHASLLTGLLPPRHGLRHNGLYRLGEAVPTLAERLQGGGWATAGFVGAVVLDARYGLDRGFAHWDDRMGGSQASAIGYPERSADAVVDAALGWLAEVERPFFLFVHLYDPHADYRPPEPWRSRFAGRPYEGEVAYADAALGRLLDALRADGRLANTLVVVTSDHGESLGEHGERTHGYGLYDATLRVPLVVSGPGVPRARVEPGVVSLASVAPTALALLGLEPLAKSDGTDLSAPWRGGAPPASRAAYAETLATRLDHGWSPLHAVRTGDRLYVRAPRPELYDARGDPDQERNLLEGDGREEETAALEAELARWLAGEREAPALPFDPATRKQLEALGYAVAEHAAPASGLDPKDGLPLVERYVRGRAALFAGDLETAETEARAVLEAWPDSPKAHGLLAAALDRSGRPEEALAHAERGAQLLPSSASLHVQVGDLLWQRGDADAAHRAYIRAASADPTDADAQLRMATSIDRTGDPERALMHYAEAARLAPTMEEAHLGAAIQLVRLGRGDEIEAHFEAAGAAGRDANGRNRLAIAFAAQGDTGRAEELFREVLREHPDHPHARRNLAHLLRTTGRAGEADAVEGAL